jgi:protein tyrosine phosphatase (PTP) superfamily phosphohydrolase (DUF442 family)
MSLSDIPNVIAVDERVLTGGQPTADQLRAVAEAGYEVVINLATLDPRHALPDEAGLVRSLGLDYHHLPVEWDRPLASDYEAFAARLDQAAGRRVFIHCAANYRVTAFYGLYAMQRLGWTAAQAEALRAPVWRGEHYPAWERLIADLRAQIAARARPESPRGEAAP